MRKNKKDLLRFENNFCTGVYNQSRDGDFKSFIVNKLINEKPKPQIQKIEQSLMFNKLKEFLPQIERENVNLLSNPIALNQKQIDRPCQQRRKIQELKINPKYLFLVTRTGTKTDKKFVDMNLLLGVFDLKNDIQVQKDADEQKTMQNQQSDEKKNKILIQEID